MTPPSKAALAPTQAMILCGGLGSRLGDLTARSPKPLLPVGERPFLDVLLFELGRRGVRRVVLLAAYHADQVRAYAGDNPVAEQFGLELAVAVEPERAGTSGALWHARHIVDDTFFLLNGDSWFDFNLFNLSRTASDAPEVAAVLALRQVADASRYGIVELSGDRVARFAARPEAPGPGLVNGGVYLMRKAVLEHLHPSGSLEQDVLPGLATQGRLAAVKAEGYFLDIGVPEAYARAQIEIPEHRRRRAVVLAWDAILQKSDAKPGQPLRWVEGGREAIRLLNDTGVYVFLAPTGASALHGQIQSDLRLAGAYLDEDETRTGHDPLTRWPVDLERSVLIASASTSLEIPAVRRLTFSSGNLAQFIRESGLA